VRQLKKKRTKKLTRKTTKTAPTLPPTAQCAVRITRTTVAEEKKERRKQLGKQPKQHQHPPPTDQSTFSIETSQAELLLLETPRGLEVRRLALQPGGTGGTPLHGGACHGQMGTVSGPPRRHDRGRRHPKHFFFNGVRADLSFGNTSGRGGAPFDTATGRHRWDTSLRRCLSRPDGDCQRTTTALRPARGGATHQKPLRGLDRMVSQHSDTKKT